mgnify:CR=1 FL=1
MGFLSRALETKASDPLSVWAEMLKAGVTAKTGATINLENALRVATLFACLRVLSQGVAQVPFKLHRRTIADGLSKIEAATGHPLYDLVTVAPNDWTTSYEFRETMMLHAALGNAYVFVNRVDGKIAELILINPARVTVEQKDQFNRPVFTVTGDSGTKIDIPQEAIWHIKGPSWSGFAGMEMLKIAREALGLSISTEETHAKLHAKGVRPSGLYTVDKTLNPVQYGQLRKWIEAELGGSENQGAALLLDSGAKYVPTAMTGLDSQHLETRKHQIEEVCRFMGVMPIMVGYSDKTATYASAEQMFIAHVVHTLSPWYARIENSAAAYLLTKRERAAGHYFKFNANGLMRGSAKDRAEFYAKGLGSGGHPGWFSPDEVRELEDMNPMGGEAAKLPPRNGPAPQEPQP